MVSRELQRPAHAEPRPVAVQALELAGAEGGAQLLAVASRTVASAMSKSSEPPRASSASAAPCSVAAIAACGGSRAAIRAWSSSTYAVNP